MEELIFFGIIIVFSILDSIARRRKAKRAAQQAPEAPREGVRTPRGGVRAGVGQGGRAAPARDPVPTYDSAPTYDSMSPSDDVATYDSEPTHDDLATLDSRPTYDSGSTYDDRESEATAAGMIPADLWEEIARLARDPQGGKAKPAPGPASAKPTPPRRTPAKRTPATKTPVEPATRLPLPEAPTRAGAPSQAIHLTHAEYGTDPSRRTRSALDAIPARARASADVRAVLTQLGGGVGALRRAIILHEVLGPPASMDSDRIAD